MYTDGQKAANNYDPQCTDFSWSGIGAYGSFRPIGTERLLDQFGERTFLPANKVCHYEMRFTLDQEVQVEKLEFPDSVLAPLRNAGLQWCAERSVHNGKGTFQKCSVS